MSALINGKNRKEKEKTMPFGVNLMRTKYYTGLPMD